MQPLIKKINELKSLVDDSYQKLKIDEKIKIISVLEEEMAVPEVWNNPSVAQDKSKKLSSMTKSVEPWVTLKAQVGDMRDLIEMGDESLLPEFEGQISALQSQFEVLRKELRLNGKFDDHNAILRLSAGAGGTDAQDWTEMLERMYLRWSDKHDYLATIVERNTGEEAGIKSSTIEISGPYVYGKLKGEHGVHRLVRLSPFNSDNLRQTSFALVEVLPQIDLPEEVNIEDKDIKVDVYRSGGSGGQSVNTTDSAVRVTHLPTGIVVSIQNERSQLQNKETAMRILKSKLAQLQLEQHTEDTTKLHAGESANWGSQIRNYVLHPYTMVKDARTKFEDRDAQSVLGGKIDGFIDAYLDSLSI